jgi:hypothetical protein
VSAPAPAPKPAPKPKAADPTRVVRAAADEEQIARFNRDLTGAGDRTARQAKITGQQTDIAKEFDDRLKRFNKQDQMWFSDNLPRLTRAQLKEYHARRERATLGMANGGKVTRYGLGT